MRSLFAPLALLFVTQTAVAAPTCALLDPEKTPRAALLEAKLLADTSATWVERVNIDKVLKEQKLQAMFSPQGVGERVKLGKLLKADVLVMVRTVKDAPEPTLEVVVSETGGGLRLLVRAVPVTKDAEADVAGLLAAVKAGIQKSGEVVKEVVAVPPFVSNNLEFTHDHLRGAFAKLVEAEALDRKGVVVVELAEADALAKEVALTAPGGKLDRPLPLYLLGEYRHEGKGSEATIGLKLRAERGGKLVGKPETLTLKPDATPEAVRKWAGAICDAIAKDDKPRPPADPKAEAKQLVERALMFKRLGNWAESLALIEASFLINPDQLDLHITAIVVITPQVRGPWAAATHEMAELEPVVQLFLRGLRHLEAYVSGGGDLKKFHDPARGTLYVTFFYSANYFNPPGPGTPAVKKRLLTLQEEVREILLRMIPILAKRENDTEGLFISWAVHHLPPAEKYKLLETLITQLQDLPRAQTRTSTYVHQGYAYLSSLDCPEFRALLQQLQDSKNADLKAAGTQLKAKLERDLKAKATPVPIELPRPDPAANRVKFTPIPLTISPNAPATSSRLLGLLAIGPGVDVLWGRQSLYLMTEKGILRQVWSSRNLNTYFETVRFDGRFVWAAVRRLKEASLLLILDPINGKVYEVTAKDGMPEPTPEQLATGKPFSITLTTLGVGRVCMAGWIERTWVGVATFDPDKLKATVKVIHEAREAGDRADKEQWTSTTIVFHPSYMATLREKPGVDGKGAVRVLLGRTESNNLDVDYTPLLVDPDKPTVEVPKTRIPVSQYRGRYANLFAESEGALYRVESTITPRFLRVGLPGAIPETIAEGCPRDASFLMFQDRRVHIVQETYGRDDPADKNPRPLRGMYAVPVRFNWYILEPGEKRPQLVGADLPIVQFTAVSSHYGIVAVVGSEKRGEPSALHSVEIATPTPKK